MKLRILVLSTIVFTLGLAATLLAQAPERGAAEAVVKGKKIMISYGRPSINGRALQGKDLFEIAPVGTVWRFGANAATTIETTADLVVGGKEVKAGKYTLWAKRTGDSTWVIAFHPKTVRDDGSGRPLWGMPEQREGYIAELPLKGGKVGEASELLAINLAEEKGKAVLKIHFGNAQYSGAFDVK